MSEVVQLIAPLDNQSGRVETPYGEYTIQSGKVVVDARAVGSLLSAGFTFPTGPYLTDHTEFYVDPAGDNRGDGSKDDPWATTQYAADIIGGTDLNGYDVALILPKTSMQGMCLSGLHSSRPSLDGYAPLVLNNTCTLFIEGHDGEDDKSLLTPISAAIPSVLSMSGSPSVNVCLKNFTIDYRTPPVDGAIIYMYDLTLFLGDGSGGRMNALGVTGDLIDACSNTSIWHQDKLYMEGTFDYGVIVGGGGRQCSIYSYADLEFGPNTTFGGQFLWARHQSYAQFAGATFTGTFNGKRFEAEAGSIIDLSELPGSSLNTIPGNAPGTVKTGGTYYSATANLP